MKNKLTEDKNIILITVDCLRADHLHCIGYPKNISPTMDSLAKNGVLFTNAIANAPYTPYSIPSFITSRVPPVERFKETISSVLKQNGYATAAFNPNPIVLTSTITSGDRINKGFDTFDLLLSSKNKYDLTIGVIRQWGMKYFRRKLNENGLFYKIIYSIYDKAIKKFPIFLCPKEHLIVPSAMEVNNYAIDWVAKQNGKFFLWIHYMDVHEPYAPPGYENQKEMMYLITKYRDFPNALTKLEIQKLMNLYDLTIEYTDRAINDLIEKLEKLNQFHNSVIIISADHGDAFGEHDNILGHGGKFVAQFYDEVIHVPLIIYGHKEKGIIVDKVVQLLDIAPTICELANVPIPVCFFGESLFSKSEKGAVINSRVYIGYRTKEYKLIISKSNSKRNELYDLINDPRERRNIYNNNKEVTKKLELEMASVLKKYKRKKELIGIETQF